MKITASSFVLLSIMVSGCATQSQLSAGYAKKCKEAELRGVINLAEAACERAWFGVDAKSLDSKIQSERLYNLARIKRQLHQYSQANKFITQALRIEEKVSGTGSPTYGLRLVELSLCLAGVGKIDEAVNTLEPVLKVANQFPEKKRLLTANIFKHFATRIRNTDQKQLASRFDLKAAELRAMKQSDDVKSN